MEEEDATATMVDVLYPLQGKSLPRDHARVLAQALERLVPWLADPREAGIHRVNAVAGIGPEALLSRRARLTLRIRRERVADLLPLAGARLDVEGHALQLGIAGVVRELRPYSTLYAHIVATEDDQEPAFMGSMKKELGTRDIACRLICGRRQVIANGAQHLTGFSLMLDGLSVPSALRILESGLGQHRSLGCGVFVPHKSGAALRA